MKQMNVKMVGTTDDPIDSLEHHAVVAKDTSLISKCCQAGARIKPSTLSRPPSTTTWRSWRKCPIPISAVSPTCKPLTKRLDHFAAHGCKVSDHALDVVLFAEANEAELDSIWRVVWPVRP
jgi:glucuronate isomerase